MLTQGKDDNKEKWQNSRREACYTLSIEGINTLNMSRGHKFTGWLGRRMQVKSFKLTSNNITQPFFGLNKVFNRRIFKLPA